MERVTWIAGGREFRIGGTAGQRPRGGSMLDIFRKPEAGVLNGMSRGRGVRGEVREVTSVVQMVTARTFACLQPDRLQLDLGF